MIDIKFKKLDEKAIIPEYQSAYAAGMDLQALESQTLYGDSIQLVGTGLAVEFPDWFLTSSDTEEPIFYCEAQIRVRSSLAAKGIILANAPGTIDSDYRGELKMLLFNTNQNPFEIIAGDRLCQVVFTPIIRGTSVEAEELTNTNRGQGGFGSTNKENK